MGTAEFQNWSVFKSVEVRNLIIPPAVPPSPAFPFGIPSLVIEPQNYNDTWNFSLGALFKVNSKFAVRMGIGFDEDATNPKDRNIALPTSHIFALGVGIHCQFLERAGFDLGYLHAFTHFQPIKHKRELPDFVLPPIGGVISETGKGRIYADMVAFQLTFDLGCVDTKFHPYAIT